MLLSRIALRSPSLVPRHTAQRTMYGEHQLVWSFFEGERNRDFLFRVEKRGLGFRAYTLSERRPVADPKVWEVDTKEFNPRFSKGQRLQFAVRVNPILRVTSGPGQGKRHDVVMHAKHQARENGAVQTIAGLIQCCGAEWLQKRAEPHGFSLVGHGKPEERLLASQYVRRTIRKKTNKAPIVLATLDLTGHLQVEDVAAFRRTIFRGLGPAKGFGCGLMMLRPVR